MIHTKRFSKSHHFRKSLIKRIIPPEIRHHKPHACLGRRANKLALRARRCPRKHGDDQSLLALQGGDERVLVVVVDVGGDHALGKDVGAFFARDARHGVLAGVDEGLGDPFAELSAGLVLELV